MPNTAADKQISVYWLGKLHPRGLIEWASSVMRSDKGEKTLTVDRWDIKKAAPKSYTANEIAGLARDVRHFGNSIVTVSVSRSAAAEPFLYLWGDFTLRHSPRAAAGEGEVGLRMPLIDLAAEFRALCTGKGGRVESRSEI